MTTRPIVLVVEDDERVRDVLGDMLDEYYAVVRAATADAAFSALTSERIDVVLLDYHLPGRSGPSVAERAGQAHVPIVWMTADLTAVETLGVDHHPLLSKPFGIDEVLEALARARRLP
jgi:DNA-binding response OmpR family regulator